MPAVVGINHFVTDTDAEIQAMKDYCASVGAEAILNTHWANGGEGIVETAKKVVELAESGVAAYAPLYADDKGLFEKIETVAKEIYRAGSVSADKKIRDQLKAWEDAGYRRLAGVHGEDAVFVFDRPQPARRADGLRPAGPRGAAVGRCRVRGCDLR